MGYNIIVFTLHRNDTVSVYIEYNIICNCKIYPVTMVSVGYHCGLSVIYPQFELAVRHLGINHYILLTVTNEQSLQLSILFHIASCSRQDIY